MAEKNHITRKLTVREFFKRFPDDDACLARIMDVRFGLRHTCQACGVVNATFHRLEKRKAYCCPIAAIICILAPEPFSRKPVRL